jgi:hypothetical protein
MRAAQLAALSGFLAGIGTASTVAQTPKGWTLEELFRRNIGTREDQEAAFPPHTSVGNLYYVGTKFLGSFLIATPPGHILINSDYERNVPTVRGSIEQLGSSSRVRIRTSIRRATKRSSASWRVCSDRCSRNRAARRNRAEG